MDYKYDVKSMNCGKVTEKWHSKMLTNCNLL